MKKSVYLRFAVIFALAVFGCEEEEEKTPYYIINPPAQTIYAVGSTSPYQGYDQKFDITGFYATRDSADITVSCNLQWQDGTQLKNKDPITVTRQGNQIIKVILNSENIGTFTILIITPDDFYGTWINNNKGYRFSSNLREYGDYNGVYLYNITDSSEINYWRAMNNNITATKTDYPVGFDMAIKTTDGVYGSKIYLHREKKSFYNEYGNSIFTKKE
jgi:hypothetical protein